MLHGEIKINGEVLFVWTARRLEQFKGEHYEHEYRLFMVDQQSGEEHTFNLKHKYSDGAVVLAGKTMAMWDVYQDDLRSGSAGSDLPPAESPRDDVRASGGQTQSRSGRTSVSDVDVPPIRSDASASNRGGTTTDRDDPGLSDIDPETNMQAKYLVLGEEEIALGYVRPFRRTYIHEKCGTATTMGTRIAETYARDPKFYGGTYCVGCNNHYPVGQYGEFVWEDGSKVGS